MANWNILSEYDPKISVVEKILGVRGIKDPSEFLNPPSISEYFKKLPLDFKRSLKKARNLIEKELENGTQIIIFGDYDSDGINAVAILYNFLKYEKGYENVFYFIPNRFDHSYGISEKSVNASLEQVDQDKDVLFITVDLGITAVGPIKYIKDLGHKIILTDHHQKSDEIPEVDCIVWSDQMCGASIAFLLSRVLGSKDPKTVCLATLATITDVIPVIGFNRSLVKKGLEVFNKSPPKGLRKLIEVADKKRDKITTYDLGWVIGPRINASGRLKSADESLKLLIEKDENIQREIAEKLNEINIERQNKTIEMTEAASKFDEKNLPKILFTASEDFHEGIVGLVAGSLVKKYYRPAVVISLSDSIGKGSVRSISGINIIELLRKHEDLFIDLGGHPMAAGFSIEPKKISTLEKKMLEEMEKIKDKEVFTPHINVDMEIPPSNINLDLISDIEKLKPFGMGNSQPIFMSKGLKITAVDTVGRDGSHLKFSFYDGNKYYKGIYFGGAKKVSDIKFGDTIDLVYTLNKNEYNGNTYIDLFVKDIKKV